MVAEVGSDTEPRVIQSVTIRRKWTSETSDYLEEVESLSPEVRKTAAFGNTGVYANGFPLATVNKEIVLSEDETEKNCPLPGCLGQHLVV